MTTRYVEVPAEAVKSFLANKGFTPGSRQGELTYEREVPGPATGLRVVVYTSVRTGAAKARGCGEDAIRVSVVYVRGDRSHGVSSAARVYRTGSIEGVLGRLLERMRSAWVVARNCAKRVCPACGAPTYADSGRCVVRECREK